MLNILLSEVNNKIDWSLINRSVLSREILRNWLTNIVPLVEKNIKKGLVGGKIILLTT